MRDTVQGLWIQGNDTVSFSGKIDTDGTFHFNDTKAEMYDRYSSTLRSQYLFEYVNLNYTSDIITEDVRLYFLSEMGSERPMFVCLKKTQEQESYFAMSQYVHPRMVQHPVYIP